MVCVKIYCVYDNSVEAAAGSAILTFTGCGIQIVLGILTYFDIQKLSTDKAYKLPTGIETENMVLISIDIVLLIISAVILFNIKKGRESVRVYLAFIFTLTLRLLYELCLASYVLIWYIRNDIVTIHFVLKGLVYILRTVMWFFSMLCVYSRYQEINAQKSKSLALDCLSDTQRMDENKDAKLVFA